MKILCIHGVGHAEANLNWEDGWRSAIANGIKASHPGLQLDPDADISFTSYDDLFASAVSNLTAVDITKATVELAGGLVHRALTLPNIGDEARWTAGMVIVWVENQNVRRQAAQRFLNDVKRIQPDLICAHSLGSLISYDAFRQDEDQIKDRTYLTFGCQLGNVFVREHGGRVEPFESAAYWFDLYNPHDHVFTAPLDFGPFQTASNFEQVLTDFGSAWPFSTNHDAVSPDPRVPDKGYLTNSATTTEVWPHLPSLAAPVVRAFRTAVKKLPDVPDAPHRRALLVGINDYPDPANRLEGCVNDVFLISSALQECGFHAEDIRVVLDDCATAAGILERLHWLLDGTAAGDERFFFYSGHGAQLPRYNTLGKIDRIDPCLVPVDFNWSRETAITDDVLLNLYSQLPYDARFMMVLDSCYSGGMTRGDARIRGLDPPDDIRHRMIEWDAKNEMWVPRDLPKINPKLTELSTRPENGKELESMRPLGRAVALRVPKARYDRLRKELHHSGPYLPMVYEACGAKEFATEYKHGVISYGAFTYAMVSVLRHEEQRKRSLTFASLLHETAQKLEDLHYDQHPRLVGPAGLMKQAIPWQVANARARAQDARTKHGAGLGKKRR